MKLILENWNKFLNEAAMGMDDLPPDTVVVVNERNNSETEIYYSSLSEMGSTDTKPYGRIIIEAPFPAGTCDGAWNVANSDADQGWGPMLYDIAIEWATQNANGLMSDRSSVEQEAENVWNFYLKNRKDVTAHQVGDENCDQEVAGDELSARITARVNYLMLDNEKKEIKEIFENFTESRNINIIPTNSEGLEMMMKVKKALDNSEIVCMLGDRVMGEEGFDKIKFLGKEARFPTYPFEVAALTGAPIITAATIKTGAKTYRQKVYDFIPFDGVTRKNRKEFIRQAMEKYASILEEIVKENPYHWFNFYDYWEEM